MVLDKTSPDLQVFEQFPDREHTHLISLEVQIPGPSAVCGAGLGARVCLKSKRTIWKESGAQYE